MSTLLHKLEGWLSQGRFAEASALEAQLTKRAGRDPRFWTGLGDVYTRLGRWSAALAARRQAVRLAPRDLNMRLALAEALAAAGYWPDAAREVEATLALGDPSESARVKAAQVWLQIGQPSRTAAVVREALGSQPSAQILFTLAACERQIGKITEAAHNIEQVLRLDPDNADAIWLRSDLTRATAEQNHVEELQTRLSRPMSPGLDTRVRYALGKELEDLGLWEAAFASFAEGAAHERARNSYDLAYDLHLLEEVRLTHSHVRRVDANGDPSSAPIFVVGLPRTGTSLVQAILASHSKVAARGELPAFDRALYDMALAAGATDERAVRRMGPKLAAADLGRLYLKEAGDVHPGTRFVDKRPFNVINIALIRAALPNARIILVARDPRDAAWAMFKTLFNEGAYGFSYALDELARYVSAYEALASHWRSKFGEEILHIRYEDVVIDLEREARRMLAYCGLEWEAGCASFQENRAPAASASAVQVRRPVYASSIGLWRRYERQLAPLLAHLTKDLGSRDPAA